ncbi:unnamed protein product [Hermetia illucens]|uniref:Secreted protein n=1 Tax=Hermetia illucens TaxID=343691 RepID=A0A7R8YXN2_HERIL|nr:unnamed protein product [Hermetia illucens]
MPKAVWIRNQFFRRLLFMESSVVLSHSVLNVVCEIRSVGNCEIGYILDCEGASKGPHIFCCNKSPKLVLSSALLFEINI